MQVMVRIAAGIAVGLVVFAAGCSAILSGATSDAMGGIATPKAALLVVGRSRRLPAVLGESGGRVAEQVASDVLEAP